METSNLVLVGDPCLPLLVATVKEIRRWATWKSFSSVVIVVIYKVPLRNNKKPDAFL